MTEHLPELAHVAGTGLAGYSLHMLHRVVGPSAKVFGATVGDFVEYRLRNWLGIAKAAEAVLGDGMPEGQVHPRVVHRILEEGTFLDDEVMQQYAGGLLAASRGGDGRDDRAAYYMNLIASLTANQVRLHHAIYSAIHDYPRPDGLEIGDENRSSELSVFTTVADAGALLAGGTPDLKDLVGEAILGLRREGLLGTTFAVAGPEGFIRINVEVTEASLLATPTPIGALLFLWGRGVPSSDEDLLGRVDLRPLDPPGPRFSAARVGRLF